MPAEFFSALLALFLFTTKITKDAKGSDIYFFQNFVLFVSFVVSYRATLLTT